MIDYRYTYDGLKKVNLATSTRIGDVYADLNVCQQGDNTQLWKSASGTYFRGMCLEHGPHNKITVMTKDEARQWVFKYYGANKLTRLGFEDAEEI